MGAHAVRSRNRRPRRRTSVQRPAWSAPRQTRKDRGQHRRQEAARRRAAWAIPVTAVLEFVAWSMVTNLDSLGIGSDSPLFWGPLAPAIGAAVSAIVGVQAAIQAKAGYSLMLLTAMFLIAAVVGAVFLWVVLAFARDFSF